MSLSLGWFLRLAIAFGLLGWLFSRVNLSELWQLLARQPLVDLLAMMVLQLLGILVATVKWRILLPALSFGCLFRFNLTALFYSLIIPGQFGPEAVKAYQLSRGRADAETIAASVAFDKVTGLLSLLAMGLVGALLTTLPIGWHLQLSLASFFAVGLAALVGLRLSVLRTLVFGVGEWLVQFSPRLERLYSQLRLFVEAWCRYLGQPAALWGSLGLGLVQQAIYIGLITGLSHQFGFDLPTLEWCWIFALVSVAAVLPISLAGVGVRDGVFVGLLAAFAVPAEQALALSLTLFALHVLFGLFGGALEILRPAGRR